MHKSKMTGNRTVGPQQLTTASHTGTPASFSTNQCAAEGDWATLILSVWRDTDSVCVGKHYLFSRHLPCFQVNVIKGITPTCLTAKTSSLERAFWMNFKITGPHPDPTQQPPSSFLSLVTQTLFPCQHHNQTKPINPKTLKHNSQDATTHRKLWNATCNATWTELYERLRRKTDHQEAGH